MSDSNIDDEHKTQDGESSDCYNPMEDIEDLVCVLQNVLTLSEKRRKVKRRFAELVYVENYQKMLQGCKPEDFHMHCIAFAQFYAANREQILETLEDDNWISDCDCKIHLGAHDAKLRRLNMILPISKIHDKAQILKEDAEKEESMLKLIETADALEGKEKEKEEDKEGDKRKDKEEEEEDVEFLPDKILYYTVSIFRSCLDMGEIYFNNVNILEIVDVEEDIKVLDEIIEILGRGIGINGREQSNNGPLGGLLDGITGFLKGSNLTGPDGKPIASQLQGVDSKAISDAMSGFFGNKELTDKITSRISSLNGKAAIDKPEDMTSVLSDMFQEVGPQLASTVVGMMDKKPPPGVTDTRTDEQRQADKFKMEQSISSMMSTAGNIAKSIDPKTLVPNSESSLDPTTSDT